MCYVDFRGFQNDDGVFQIGLIFFAFELLSASLSNITYFNKATL